MTAKSPLFPSRAPFLPRPHTEASMESEPSLLSAGTIQAVGLSDPGRVRPINEDGLLMLPHAGVFAVADGLGGLDAGDVASRTALDQLRALYSGTDKAACCPFSSLAASRGAPPLAEVLEEVNLRTYRRKIALGRNMATTLAMVQTCPSFVLIAHVGDSRIYLLRDNTLERLTTDHSLVNELVATGAMTAIQAEQSDQRHVLTRAMGAGLFVEPSLRRLDRVAGDRLLLCTDGLTSMLNDGEIGEILLAAGKDPSVGVKRLVQSANDAGGRDNITVVLVALM